MRVAEAALSEATDKLNKVQAAVAELKAKLKVLTDALDEAHPYVAGQDAQFAEMGSLVVQLLKHFCRGRLSHSHMLPNRMGLLAGSEEEDQPL